VSAGKAAIPPDVERYVARRFDAADRSEALALLAAAVMHDGSTPEARLLRCAAVASGGSMERLRMEIETLRHDYRDVIVEGEYIPRGRALVKVRNLREPIPDDA
jgi:hypothetical protein